MKVPTHILAANVHGVREKRQVHVTNNFAKHQLHAALSGGDIRSGRPADISIRVCLHSAVGNSSSKCNHHQEKGFVTCLHCILLSLLQNRLSLKGRRNREGDVDVFKCFVGNLSSSVQLAVHPLREPLGKDAVDSASERSVGTSHIPTDSSDNWNDQVSCHFTTGCTHWCHCKLFLCPRHSVQSRWFF